MELLIDPRGVVRGLYAETLDLRTLGTLAIRRASHIEPGSEGAWYADLSPVKGPMLGPFVFRSQALEAEVVWLLQHPESWDTVNPTT